MRQRAPRDKQSGHANGHIVGMTMWAGSPGGNGSRLVVMPWFATPTAMADAPHRFSDAVDRQAPMRLFGQTSIRLGRSHILDAAQAGDPADNMPRPGTSAAIATIELGLRSCRPTTTGCPEPPTYEDIVALCCQASTSSTAHGRSCPSACANGAPHGFLMQ